MWHTIILIIGSLIVLAGVINVYDARPITERVFGFGDQNEATLGLKMIGFILIVVGSLIILINK